MVVTTDAPFVTEILTFKTTILQLWLNFETTKGGGLLLALFGAELELHNLANATGGTIKPLPSISSNGGNVANALLKGF